MRHGVLLLALSALCLCLAFSPVVLAADKDNTHEGLVIAAAAGRLTMTDNAGKNEHTHSVAPDAKITCNGKECKLEDLKKGFKVKVTIEKKDGKEQATRIEAKKPS